MTDTADLVAADVVVADLVDADLVAVSVRNRRLRPPVETRECQIEYPRLNTAYGFIKTIPI